MLASQQRWVLWLLLLCHLCHQRSGVHVAFPLITKAPARAGRLAKLAALPKVAALPPPAKAKAPVAVPRAPEFAVPKLAWPKPEAVPAIPFVVPTKAAPLLAHEGGEDDADVIPNSLVGRKASDILQRVRDITMAEISYHGAVLGFFGAADETITAAKTVSAAMCRPWCNLES